MTTSFPSTDTVQVYMMDTNVIRYQVGRNSSLEERRLKQAAIEFWGTVQEETLARRTEIMLPKEVVAELDIQMHSLTLQKQDKLRIIIESLLIDSFDLSLSLEYDLRKFSSYVIHHYREHLIPKQQTTMQHGKSSYKIEYLQTSDARILVSAYLNDAILVTRNIKDFIVYLLFCAPEEKRLYDFVEKQFVTIPAEGLDLICQDSYFQEVRSKLEQLLVGEE